MPSVNHQFPAKLAGNARWTVSVSAISFAVAPSISPDNISLLASQERFVEAHAP